MQPGYINTELVIVVLDRHLSVSQEHKHVWIITHGHWHFRFHLHLPGPLQTGRKEGESFWGVAGHRVPLVCLHHDLFAKLHRPIPSAPALPAPSAPSAPCGSHCPDPVVHPDKGFRETMETRTVCAVRYIFYTEKGLEILDEMSYRLKTTDGNSK